MATNAVLAGQHWEVADGDGPHVYSLDQEQKRRSGASDFAMDLAPGRESKDDCGTFLCFQRIPVPVPLQVFSSVDTVFCDRQILPIRVLFAQQWFHLYGLQLLSEACLSHQCTDL